MGMELSEDQLDSLRSKVTRVSWEEAQPILSCLRKTQEFKRWKKQLSDHPGPVTRLAHEVLMLAMFFAADEKGRVHRTTVCEVINGMETRIWLLFGMCTNKDREPISFNVVWQQFRRLEKLPQITQEEMKAPRKELHL